MELVDLLPHQRGDGVAAGNDALRLSEKIKTGAPSSATSPGLNTDAGLREREASLANEQSRRSASRSHMSIIIWGAECRGGSTAGSEGRTGIR